MHFTPSLENWPSFAYPIHSSSEFVVPLGGLLNLTKDTLAISRRFFTWERRKERILSSDFLAFNHSLISPCIQQLLHGVGLQPCLILSK